MICARIFLSYNGRMHLSARDYIGHMESLGLFRAGHAVPEFNTGVWRDYLDLYDTHVGQADSIKVSVTPEGLGFYRDELAGWDFYTWALLGPLSHPRVPFTARDIIHRAPAIAALCADVPVITETFIPEDDCAGDPHFGWICSPQAHIAASPESYAASLAPKRRKQRARLYREYDDPSYRFDFSANPVTDDECAFILDQTRARWGEEAPYALTQALFPLAAARNVPDAVRFMRVYHGDDLLFFNTYLVRGAVMTSQSTTRNMAAETRGLGVIIDFRAIDLL
jgi:hypothetical protein